MYYTVLNCYSLKISDSDLTQEVLTWIKEVQAEQYLGDYFVLQELQVIEGLVHFCKKRYQEKLTKQQVIEELEKMWKISQSGKC